jgi:hypothetical protein
MIQSKQILEWQTEGELRRARLFLLRALEVRFPGALPRKFVKLVEASENLKQLKHWFDAALTAEDWEMFAKTVNGTA